MLNSNFSSFSSWPSYTEKEAKVVKQILLSNKVNYWTGSECRIFEQEFANWIQVKYAVALANGTVALEAALKAIELQPGDEVIVTARTFIASVSTIIIVGGVPVFADVDVDSQNITVDTIKPVVTNKTKAIICVHLAGWPCDMDPIMELAEKHNLYVIEDCAQAHGAKYKGKSVGAIGHIAAWSFCQDKIITTGGEGGMITTNIKSLWEKVWSYKDHGKGWDAVYNSNQLSSGFRWVHGSFGSNWRMTEIQGAIGRIQLEYISAWHKIRSENAKTIWSAAAQIQGLRVPKLPDFIEHAAYKCYIFVENEKLAPGWNRARIIQEINANGVPCFVGSCSEVYLEKAFDNTGYRPKKRLPMAKLLGETSIMFMVHPTLTKAEIERTCMVLRKVMEAAV